MARFFRRKRSKVSKGSRKGTTGSKPSRTMSMIKTLIKKEFSRNAENKCAQYYGTLLNIGPVANTAVFANSVIPISPYASYLSIQQGTSQGQRVGNRIKIKNLTFKGSFVPSAYNATTNPVPRPCNIVMWLFYKYDNPDTLTVPGNDFLQLGGSSQALTGGIIDQTAPINTDSYRVLAKRVFKLGFAAYEGTGITVSQQAFHNNDYKYNCPFSINVTKYLVKNVKFDDNTTSPTTRGLFACFEAVSATGGAMTSAYIPAELSYTLDCSYEDA